MTKVDLAATKYRMCKVDVTGWWPWLDPADQDVDSVTDSFWQAVATNLRDGQIRLILFRSQGPPGQVRLNDGAWAQTCRVGR